MISERGIIGIALIITTVVAAYAGMAAVSGYVGVPGVTNSQTSLPDSPSASHRGFSFRDDFTYNTLADLQSAGWTLCGGGNPQTYYSVGSSLLNLTNDGVIGAAACYNNIPAGVASWTVSASGRWNGNSYGSIEIVVNTASHRYRWDADGYYNQFILLRDDVIVFRVNGYNPVLNTWHTLRLDANRRTGLTFFFDGQQIGTFSDIRNTDYTMMGLVVMAGWISKESWDWITASSA